MNPEPITLILNEGGNPKVWRGHFTEQDERVYVETFHSIAPGHKIIFYPLDLYTDFGRAEVHHTWTFDGASWSVK